MIATASGCLALLCIIGWPFFSNYRTVVKIQSVGAAAFTLYFLTLGSPTAAMACLISCSQLLISASVRDRYVVTRLYGASFILLVFLSVVTWHGIPSALALTGSSLGSLARLQTSTSRMKGLFLVGAPFWLAHNLMVGAVADSEMIPPAIPRNSRPGFRPDPAPPFRLIPAHLPGGVEADR